MSFRLTLFVCLAVISLTACHTAPHKLIDNSVSINHATIYGKVTYKGKPVENVVLGVMESHCFGLSIRKILTNKAEEYRFDTLPANVTLKLAVNNFIGDGFVTKNKVHTKGTISFYESTCGIKKEGFLLPKGRSFLRQDIELKKRPKYF